MPEISARSSHAVQNVVAAFWKEAVRAWPPQRREQWLKTAEAIAGLGAKRCRQLLKDLEHFRKQATATVPSSAWLDGILRTGETFPPPVDAPRSPQAMRRGMVLCEFPVRIGEKGPGSRRWTPIFAAELEDLLDGMSEAEAWQHDYPPSPSAVAIIRVAESGGRERTGRSRH